MEENFKRLQNAMFINMHYGNGSIKKVINEIDNLKLTSLSNNCKDQKWVNYIGKISGKLQLIETLISYKKLKENKADIIEIGKYLQKLGKELENFKDTDLENQDSNSQDFIGDMIKDILKDITGGN